MIVIIVIITITTINITIHITINIDMDIKKHENDNDNDKDNNDDDNDNYNDDNNDNNVNSNRAPPRPAPPGAPAMDPDDNPFLSPERLSGGAEDPLYEAAFCWQLPNGVKTNGVFAEVLQYTMIYIRAFLDNICACFPSRGHSASDAPASAQNALSRIQVSGVRELDVRVKFNNEAYIFLSQPSLSQPNLSYFEPA